MVHKIEQNKSKSKSTNNKYSIYRDKVDNDTMEYEFEIINNRNESKDKRYTNYSNSLDHRKNYILRNTIRSQV